MIGVVLYLGGCGACGALVAWLRARGLPFVTGSVVVALPSDEG